MKAIVGERGGIERERERVKLLYVLFEKNKNKKIIYTYI
jgi:hypothetical protein